MKKRIFLALAIIAILACIFAISVSAASTTGNIDYNETAKLSDGTVLPIYDANKNPLIWYISGTETVTVDGVETTKNVYSSVVSTATKESPDANGYYVSYGSSEKTYTGPTGETLQYYYNTSIYVKHITDSTVNFKGDDTMVIANLRGVDRVGDIQGGTIDKLQYFYAPENMVRSGDFRISSLLLADFTQSTNMREVIDQAFSSGVAGKIKEVRFPTIEPVYNEEGVLVNAFKISNFGFQNCKLITSLDFPETLYSVGNNAFQNCNNLTTIGDVPNLTIINADAFESCWTLTGLDFKNTKLTTIGARAFRYAGLQDEIEFPSTLTSIGDNAFYQGKLIKAIKLPSTLETLGSQVFRQITTLEYFDFGGFSMETMGDYFFWKNSSLKAVSLPEGLKSFGTRPFEGCAALEVVYLPDSLTTLTYFQNITNLYFVNDPFAIDWESGIFDSGDWNGQKPEKPSIYYMPTSLTSFSSEADLHSCTGINDTVVFPAGLKEVTHQYTFFAIPNRNFVFLGEVTLLNVNSTAKSNYYFIDDDVTADSLTIQGNGSHNIYYHSQGVHLCENSVVSLPDCVTNSFEKQICYCGTEIQTTELENTALGHSHTVLIDIIYADYTKPGYYSYKCERCDDLNNEKSADALFKSLGYSAAEYAEGGISIGFTVNDEAIKEYEEATGKAVSYGVFAVRKDKIGNSDIFDENGKSLDGVIAADITDAGFVTFNLKIVGFNDDQLDIKIAMGAFVGTTKDGVAEYAYMQDQAPQNSDKYYFASFNDIAALVESKEIEAQ